MATLVPHQRPLHGLHLAHRWSHAGAGSNRAEPVATLVCLPPDVRREISGRVQFSPTWLLLFFFS